MNGTQITYREALSSFLKTKGKHDQLFCRLGSKPPTFECDNESSFLKWLLKAIICQNSGMTFPFFLPPPAGNKKDAPPPAGRLHSAYFNIAVA